MAIKQEVFTKDKANRRIKAIDEMEEIFRKRKDPGYVQYMTKKYYPDLTDDINELVLNVPTGQQQPQEAQTQEQYIEPRTLTEQLALKKQKAEDLSISEKSNKATSLFKERLSAFDELLKDESGLKSATGTGVLGRGADISVGGVGLYTNPDRSRFAGGAGQILSTEALQELIDAKAGGATFGALSNEELRMLQQSSTKIGNWAIRDKDGRITGFNVDEGTLKKELTSLKNMTQDALNKTIGTQEQIQPQQQTEQPIALNTPEEAISFLKQNPNSEYSQEIIDGLKSIGVDYQPMAETSMQGEQGIQPIQETVQPQEQGSWFDSIMGSAEKRAEKVGEIQQGKSGIGSKLFQTFGQGTGLASDIINTVVGRSLSAITPDSIEQPVKDALGMAMENILSTDTAKNIGDKWTKFKEENPEMAGNIEAGGNVAMLGASVSPSGRILETTGKVAGRTGEIASNIAGGVAGKVKGGAESVGRFATSQATGLPRESISTIVGSPEQFSKEAMKGTNRLSVSEKVKEAIDTRLENLSETGKAYEDIKNIVNPVIIPQKSLTSVLDRFGIGLSKDGKVMLTSESVPLKSGDINEIEKFFSQYGQNALSPNGFLNARASLSEMAKYDATKTGYSEKIAKGLREALDTHGKAQIKGLAEIDRKYAPEVKFLGKIKKDYFDNNGELKDGALSKIANLTGAGKEKVLMRLEEIVPNIRKDINILNVIEQTKNSDFRTGAYIKAGLIGGAASGGNPFVAFTSALLGNPEISIPIIRAYGIAKGVSSKAVDSLIEKMETGKKLVSGELKFIDETLRVASGKMEGKLKEKIKGIRQ